MLLPRLEGVYDYWVNICPMDAEFSSKAAAMRLRQASKNAAAWGTITLDGRPILELLCENVIQSELPTSIGALLRNIQDINDREAAKFKAKIELHARDLYIKEPQ